MKYSQVSILLNQIFYNQDIIVIKKFNFLGKKGKIYGVIAIIGLFLYKKTIIN